MKKVIFTSVLLLTATAVQAQGTNPTATLSRPHLSGTYVQPYVATNPNSKEKTNLQAACSATTSTFKDREEGETGEEGEKIMRWGADLSPSSSFLERWRLI